MKNKTTIYNLQNGITLKSSIIDKNNYQVVWAYQKVSNLLRYGRVQPLT